MITDSETYMSNILQDLLHIDTNSATLDQKEMFDRIINENKVCSNDDRMLCLVDSLLRNIAKDLADDGITNVSDQVDIKTFDTFMARLLSTLDKETFAAYTPYVIDGVDRDFYLWSEQGPEFKSYMKMAQELYSLLVNRESFSPSDIISPFIIADASLKKKAIQELIQSPSFQLKPLDINGKFYEMMTKIKEQQKDIDINPGQSETIVIELDRVLNFNFAEVISELNSTDVSNVTAIIDQSNGNVFQYINDKEELVLINLILRSLLGDILGVILDLPGKLFGAGGKGKEGKNKGKGGLTITISVGGESADDSKDGIENPNPSPRRRPPPNQ